jgi:lysophospholipase L1-like esterase
VRRWGPRLLALVALLAVVVAPTNRAEAADELVYVALGDSFTSGPLVLPHDTTWVPEDCGQSTRNYPHLAAAAIGATRFVDVSCGSATIDDLYEPQTGLPLGGTNAPQLDALGPDVDVVTLGIGGNDVGFVGLALDCVRLLGPPHEQPCTPDHRTADRDRVSERIAATAPELGQALDDIHAAAPSAEVFVVSYPTSLPDDGVACWPYLPILPEDMPYLVEKFKEMNAMLAEQAALHDATYVDVYTPSIGHDACRPPGVAWVNGMVVVPPSYPAHPNELGLAQSAEVVAATISGHHEPNLLSSVLRALR